MARLPEPPHLLRIDCSEMQLEIVGMLTPQRHYAVRKGK
jgi:hypothetical protein